MKSDAVIDRHLNEIIRLKDRVNNLETLLNTRFNIIDISINELLKTILQQLYLIFFITVQTFKYRTNVVMTYKRMYYLVSIDKIMAYYKTYYQQNKERYKQRYAEQKLKLHENEASVESNDHNKPLSAFSKV